MIGTSILRGHVAKGITIFGVMTAGLLTLATLAHAQDTIRDTFTRAANEPEKKSEEAALPEVAPAPAADAGSLPALPSDDESLRALTEALAADQAALDEQTREERAFDRALKGTFPLSPEQIQEVMRRMSEAQEAGRAPPSPEPTASVKVENVSLEPGVMPPMIAVAQGYVTTVNMLDITGQPWPIQDVVIGGNFKVTGPNDGHILRIIPQTRFGRGNLSVRLVGLSTPVTFRVESGGSQVYYRYDARVPQSGPGAKTPIIEQGFTGQAGDAVLMGVLEGVAPSSAKKLNISGTDGRTRAWKINGATYVRTPLTLLSPGWEASVRSADGTNVYVLADAPILMLSDNGQMVRAKIEVPPEDPFRPDDLKEGNITVPISAPATAAPPAGQTALPATTETPAAAPTAAPQNLPGGIEQESNVIRRGGTEIITGGNGDNIVINGGGS